MFLGEKSICQRKRESTKEILLRPFVTFFDEKFEKISHPRGFVYTNIHGNCFKFFRFLIAYFSVKNCLKTKLLVEYAQHSSTSVSIFFG